eukprot:gene4559-5681_t
MIRHKYWGLVKDKFKLHIDQIHDLEQIVQSDSRIKSNKKTPTISIVLSQCLDIEVVHFLFKKYRETLFSNHLIIGIGISRIDIDLKTLQSKIDQTKSRLLEYDFIKNEIEVALEAVEGEGKEKSDKSRKIELIEAKNKQDKSELQELENKRTNTFNYMLELVKFNLENDFQFSKKTIQIVISYLDPVLHRDTVETLLSMRDQKNITDITTMAVSTQNLNMVKYLYNLKFKFDLHSSINIASGSGPLDLLVFLEQSLDLNSFSNNCSTTTSTNLFPPPNPPPPPQLSNQAQIVSSLMIDNAAKNAIDLSSLQGHYPIVKFLHNERKEGCTVNAINFAATCNHLEIVDFLFKNRTEGATKQAFKGAILNGHTEILEYLMKNLPHLATPEYVWKKAAGNNKVEIISYLHSNQVQGYSKAIMEKAASSGSLDVVKFLHFNRNEYIGSDPIYGAARNGKLDVVRFLYLNRREGSASNIVYAAAEKNQTSIINFIQTNRTDRADNYLDSVKHKSYSTCKSENLESIKRFDNFIKRKGWIISGNRLNSIGDWTNPNYDIDSFIVYRLSEGIFPN